MLICLRPSLSTLATITEGLEPLWLNDQDADRAEDTRAHINTFLVEEI